MIFYIPKLTHNILSNLYGNYKIKSNKHSNSKDIYKIIKENYKPLNITKCIHCQKSF